MKKLLITLVLALTTFTTQAQITRLGDVNRDGQLTISDVMILLDAILNGAEEKGFLTCPDKNHPHLIDLGLPSGTLWSCCNVDATAPEGKGGAYAWGETEVKAKYVWDNYLYSDVMPGTDYFLGNSIIGDEYDVAFVKWGKSWKMPSAEQIEELVSNCFYEQTTMNGVACLKCTGYNGGTLILPVGMYWSGTQAADNISCAACIDVTTGKATLKNSSRAGGNAIRPVYESHYIAHDRELVLSRDKADLVSKESDTIKITSGNGAYKMVNSNTSSLKATLKDKTIILNAITEGDATVTVTDTKTNATKDITVTVKNLCPDDNHPHLIDLDGSLTRVSCCNFGASKPWDYGSSFAWGETKGKVVYDWSTYKHCDGSYSTCHDIGTDISGTKYDVVHARWGDGWYTPKYTELFDKWTLTTVNGIKGAKVTGSTGNTVFLPAAGYRSGEEYKERNSIGYYWLSGTYSGNNWEAYCLIFDKWGIHSIMDCGDADWCPTANRCYGMSFRPFVTMAHLNFSSGKSFAIGESIEIPFNAGKNPTVECSNPEVASATIDTSKNVIIVSALKAGETTVTLADGYGYSDAAVVKVIPSSCPDDNHPHLIDLGLPSGTKWACCNIDPNTSLQSPSNYGGYYAWGETETKSIYTKNTYNYMSSGYSSSYNNIGSDISGTKYDVAHMKWGGTWKMPTDEQFNELIKNCEMTHTMMDNVKGNRYVAPNGKSIFLPASGYMENYNKLERGNYVHYWASTMYRYANSYDRASILYSTYTYSSFTTGKYRYFGLPVRPVK